MSILTKRSTLVLAGLIVVLGGVFAVRAHSQTTKSTVAQDLNLYEASPITSLDVAHITDNVSSGQLAQVGEGLFRLNAKSQPENALAKKTTVSHDGTVYTIDLKSTGRWSNGDPVTAQDFVYSWRRTLDPKSKSEFTYQFSKIKNANAVAAGKKQPSALGVKATGKHQLKITLAQTTVYNGPFKVTKWNGTGDTWTLKKNPTYRDKQAIKLNQLNYRVIKSSATSYNLFQSKKLDAVTLDGEQTRQNQHNSNLKTLASGRIGFIQYNQQDTTAANRNLRTAISLAINRQQLTQKFLRNGSLPAHTFAVRHMQTAPKTGHDFTQDATVAQTADYAPKQAQQHFQTALKRLHRSKINLTLICADDDTTKQLAEFIQGTLNDKLKGLNVDVKAVPFPSMLSAVSKGNFQANLTSWGMDYADPIESLQILKSDNNSNMGHYHSATYDAALTKAEGADALKPAQRYQDLVKAAQTAMHDQAVTPLYDARTNILVNPQVKGVVYNQFDGSADYRHAYVAQNN